MGLHFFSWFVPASVIPLYFHTNLHECFHLLNHLALILIPLIFLKNCFSSAFIGPSCLFCNAQNSQHSANFLTIIALYILNLGFFCIFIFFHIRTVLIKTCWDIMQSNHHPTFSLQIDTNANNKIGLFVNFTKTVVSCPS